MRKRWTAGLSLLPALNRDAHEIHIRMNAAPPRPKTADLLGMPPRSAFKRKWTYTQACAELPETLLPIEIWDGTLVMAPSPFFHHQDVVSGAGQTIPLANDGILHVVNLTLSRT